MANKIISFDSSQNLIDQNTLSANPELSTNYEIFKDVSMESVYSGHVKPTNENDPNYNENIRLWEKMSSWKIQDNVNVKAIFDSLRNIFTWHQGERILLPEFGSQLHMLLYEGITDETEEAIIAEIRSCISEWEPRIQIESIANASTIADIEDNVIHIEIIFTIPALGDELYTYDFSYIQSQ